MNQQLEDDPLQQDGPPPVVADLCNWKDAKRVTDSTSNTITNINEYQHVEKSLPKCSL